MEICPLVHEKMIVFLFSFKLHWPRKDSERECDEPPPLPGEADDCPRCPSSQLPERLGEKKDFRWRFRRPRTDETDRAHGRHCGFHNELPNSRVILDDPSLLLRTRDVALPLALANCHHSDTIDTPGCEENFDANQIPGSTLGSRAPYETLALP